MTNIYIACFTSTLERSGKIRNVNGAQAVLAFTSINFSQCWIASNALVPSGSIIFLCTPWGLSCNLPIWWINGYHKEVQSKCDYHFMISVSPSSHMNVPPPLGTTSLKRSTERRDCSDESRKWVNQLPSLWQVLVTFFHPVRTDTTSLVHTCANFQGP